jgi:hypothetical protein
VPTGADNLVILPECPRLKAMSLRLTVSAIE